MRRAPTRRLLAVAVGATLGCASAAERETGPFLAAGFSAEELAREPVAVLPIDAVEFPDGLPDSVARDSLALALANYGGDVLAAALVERGAAGRGLGPVALAPALESLGSTVLGRTYAELLRSPPARETEGALSDTAVEDFESLDRVVGARFILVPLRLSFAAVEPLRFLAELDVALVDAGVGRTVWRAVVSARNPVAPPGDAPDLYAAALEDATSAVADRVARRLATAGELDPGEPVEDLAP